MLPSLPDAEQDGPKKMGPLCVTKNSNGNVTVALWALLHLDENGQGLP